MDIYIKRFYSEDSGAVTVDWVVLVGLIIAMFLAVAPGIVGGTIDYAGDIDSSLEQQTIPDYAP